MKFPNLKAALDALAGERLPGASLCVSINDEPAFACSAGFSDEENGIETGTDTRYSAYSMTKLLTAVAVLKAAEQGKLELDAQIGDYLRGFHSFTVLLNDERGRRIVDCDVPPHVRHLLTMSAGFGEDMRQLGCAPTREAVSALAEQPLFFEPGTHWLYGLCYEVLGAVLEETYGQKLREIFRTEIFVPCGMTDSCFLSEIRDYSTIAPTYKAIGGSYVACALDKTYAPHPEYDSAGAGLVSTAADYDRFLRALMHGRLVSEKSLALMKRDSLTADMRRDFNWPQTRGYGYGLGIRVPRPNSGLRDYGWGGAAGAYSLMDFELDASLSFFTNVTGADETFLYPLLHDAFYADMDIQ